MGDVVHFGGLTVHRTSIEKIMQAVPEWCDDERPLVVVGTTKEGELVVAANTSDAEQSLATLMRAQHQLCEMMSAEGESIARE